MAFLRPILTTETTAIAATAAISAPAAVCSFSSSSFSISSLRRSFEHPPSVAVIMDQDPQSENVAVMPELMGCVKSVEAKFQTVDGVKNIDVDLTNRVVYVLATSPVKILTEALEQTGRKARLIGQGTPEDFLVSAAVAEFEGPVIFGVVRLAQVNMGLPKIEATFSCLAPGKHGWSINQFGDLTMGTASTGKAFNPTNCDKEVCDFVSYILDIT